MEAEHCERPDSLDEFVTRNYRLSTHPAQEWRIVTDAKFGAEFSKGHRVIKDLQELERSCVAVEAGLTRPEVIALVLYTGLVLYVCERMCMYLRVSVYAPQALYMYVSTYVFVCMYVFLGMYVFENMYT